MGYAPRLTIENYVMAMLRANYALLPPRRPGCYSVWYADFQGLVPPASAKNEIVLVGKTERGPAELLYRVTGLVVDAIGITGSGTLSGTKYSFFHKGGRDIFLSYGNADATKLLVTWRDDVCPSCEEHRIYALFADGRRLLNQQKVPPCLRHP
jgi:hypothetical protein